MLELTVEVEEGFNESTSEFIPMKTATLQLEHSLVSLSKWESKWEKSFLDRNTEKTDEMMLDYIRFMVVSGDVTIIEEMSRKNVEQINEYINAKHTATFFNERGPEAKRGPSGKVITSDLIYYWMVALTIPFTCETWHLNRLLTLIRITEMENRPKKKMPRRESMSRHRALNQSRRAQQGM